MENRLFGFLLDEGIQLDIANKRIMRYQAETPESAMYLRIVTLSDIQLRLLLLLLTNKPGDVILKNDIMMNMLSEDGKELLSSNQKLWYLMKVLRKKLSSIGMEEGFISNAYGVGYFVNAHNVSPIFI
ncbi:hypothetical protein Z042_13900 [Chania multitudinisentens RB-25]|uniref:OmpR/PhoB-type domain-containing protein n=1 Tax=Chania multitudinisentens RB-25 TaxID=1441930 RepID=W0LLB0_9GAMM|nr:winged helix-turn-helix domain-containing protein [Chania multitudinisentens]AHG22800.1 hypothetical protein Z042_13900 [Chania multitudinisentens RB-25]